MQRSSSLLVGFFAAILLLIGTSGECPVMAQGKVTTDRVSSVSESANGDSITIVTSSSAPLPAPNIRYLPGPDGDTILVADFEGLTYSMEPRVVHPSDHGAPVNGIDEIRIAQFQESPAICRVSVFSRNPLYFKGVNFKSHSGQLVMSWNNDLAALKSMSAAEKAAALKQQTIAERRRRRFLPGYPYTASGLGPMRITDASARVTRLTPAASSPSSYSAQNTNSSADEVAFMPPPPNVSLTPHTQIGADNTTASTVAPKPAPTIKRPKKETSPKTERAERLVLNDGTGEPLPEEQNPRSKGNLFGRFFPKGQGSQKGLTNSEQLPSDKLTSADPAENPAPAGNVRIKVLPPEDHTAPAKNMTASKTKTAKDATGKVAKAAPPEPPVKLQMVVDENSAIDNLRIELTAKRKISYRAFQLHNPERYVIDFDRLPELSNLAMPDSDSPLLFQLRTGKIDDRPDAARLVLDLPPNEDIQVQDMMDTERNLLTLSLVRVSDSPTAGTAFSIPPLGQMNAPGQRVIVIDAGHGGTDPGAQRGTVQEKDITLGITQKLKRDLEQSGARVIMTRSDDTFVSLEDRVKVTNQLTPDLFVSVHINALESVSDIHGVETYFQTEQSKPLADSIHQSLVAKLSAPDRSVRRARFYVINHTSVPAVLAEVGYISNKDERDKLVTAEYQDQVAQALAQGIFTYLAKAPDAGNAVRTASQPVAAPTRTQGGQGTTSFAAKSSSQAVETASGVGRLTR